MKSFFKGALEACYIGGNSINHFPNIKGEGSKGKLILSFDTEQGNYHVAKSQERTLQMIGSKTYPGLVTFPLREYTASQRVEIIDGILKSKLTQDRVGLVTIDGIADLVDDVNSLEQSNYIAQKLLTWSKQYNIAIIVVIHANYDSEKATGHLGSVILKKVETACYVKREDSICSVNPTYTRNISFDKFNFEIQNGLLYESKNDVWN